MLSIPHLLIVLFIVLILFGSKLPSVMGNLGKGIKNLRDELNADENNKVEESKQQILPPEDKK